MRNGAHVALLFALLVSTQLWLPVAASALDDGEMAVLSAEESAGLRASSKLADTVDSSVSAAGKLLHAEKQAQEISQLVQQQQAQGGSIKSSIKIKGQGSAARGQLVHNAMRTRSQARSQADAQADAAPAKADGPADGYSPKSFMTTLLYIIFLGWFGGDQFYLGNNLAAVGKLFTLGGCGLWNIYNFVQLMCGDTTDSQGRKLAFEYGKVY